MAGITSGTSQGRETNNEDQRHWHTQAGLDLPTKKKEDRPLPPPGWPGGRWEGRRHH